MAGITIVNDGKKIVLDRSFNASPTRTAPSLFKVGTGTTSPTATDTDLGTAVTIDADDTKDFQVGFPSMNYSTLQTTIRCFLELTEANGNSLTEFGIFNEDGTALMYSHAVNTAISKTTSVEIAFVQKDKLE